MLLALTLLAELRQRINRVLVRLCVRAFCIEFGKTSRHNLLPLPTLHASLMRQSAVFLIFGIAGASTIGCIVLVAPPIFWTSVLWALFLLATSIVAAAVAAVCAVARRSRLAHAAAARTGALPRAVVVVGGDFARSPRMQYHAVSLADSGRFSAITCLGYDCGNRCCEDVCVRAGTPAPGTGCTGGRISLAGLIPVAASDATAGVADTGSWLRRVARRVAGLTWSFGGALLAALEPPPDGAAPAAIVLLQVPPAVPFLPVVLAAVAVSAAARALLRHSLPASTWGPRGAAAAPQRPRVVVDWHNFGYTLLALDRRPPFVVALYKGCERLFGRCADAHLTVSHAMRGALAGGGDAAALAALKATGAPSFGLPRAAVRVVHDTAPAFFAPCGRAAFVAAIDAANSAAGGPTPLLAIPDWMRAEAADEADAAPGRASPMRRGLFLVSSTSWTADDDYTLVVAALRRLDAWLTEASSTSPFHVWLVCTGKGETRARFEAQVAAARLRPHITVATVYFQSFQLYAATLGAADAGLSLHRSSSGLDLPMKVVDMFGCGLPVAALAYAALPELLDGRSGWTFETSEGLLRALKSMVLELREGAKDAEGVAQAETAAAAAADDDAIAEGWSMAARRAFVRRHKRASWADTWSAVALPVVEELLQGPRGRKRE